MDNNKNFYRQGCGLNVIANGSQHERNFADAEKQILACFDQHIPLEKQPKYIADIGCGDGAFLKRIYLSLCDQTERGKHLLAHPVQLIGIDSGEATLIDTEKVLKDLPHLILKGDINIPEKLLSELDHLGIKDTENILYVCSSLDIDFRYDSPISKVNESQKATPEISLSGNSVNSPDKSLSHDKLIDTWREYLQKWAQVLKNNPHGLFVLELNRLVPQMTGYDFSGQNLLDAEVSIVLAANVGFFTKTEPLPFSNALSSSQIVLSHLEARNYQVRYAKGGDLDGLQGLEELCWADDLQMSREVLAKRLSDYPEGQFVIVLDGKVVGVIYSQRIADKKALQGVTSEGVSRLHRADGPVVQLLAVNIDPQFQGRQLGDQLLEFMLQRCALMPGINSVIGVTLCHDYHKQKRQTMTEYIHQRNEQGLLSDPILRFHELHGASVTDIIPQYRPKDVKNEGYGVLVYYDIHNRRRKEVKINAQGFSDGEQVSLDEEDVEEFLEDVLRKLLGSNNGQAFSKERPLMEMGLDSADLLNLSEQMSFKFQRKLESTFFFQYNTHTRIVSYFKELLLKEQTKEKKPENEIPISSHAELTKPGSITAKVPVDAKKSFFNHSEDSHNDEIAIIGMACRLPGGINTPEELWHFLKNGENAIGIMPEGRWSWPHDIDPDKEHIGIDRGGFLEDMECFDAPFFRISPKEVKSMDPQQRILMELSWMTLEDAGYPADTLVNTRTGVFIGASGSDYNRILDQAKIPVNAHVGTGCSMAVLANRISYFYDFHGPSLVIDTACSSSLVAVHKAVQSLQTGESSIAMVGGVNLMCHPANSIAYYKAGMLSSDGKCKTFDRKANGYVRSEGAVMLLLKPMAKAIAEQDRIYAVIKGTACNHGGQASGLTVPNPEQQARLLVDAWQTANISPDTISYIETHGTGTSLGDPVEVQGLKDAFFQALPPSATLQTGTCGLSSIKTNLGHLEAAAGIAGLLKVVLSLQHQELTPSLHFEELNDRIHLADTPFYIIDRHRSWLKTNDQSLHRAGVSSFGSGGTNAHVVLEEYPQKSPEKQWTDIPAAKGPFLFVLSARSKERLQVYTQKFVTWLEGKKEDNFFFESLIYTLQTARQAMEERLAILVSDQEDLIQKLTAFCQQETGGERAPRTGFSLKDCYQKNAKTISPEFKILTEGVLGEQLLRFAIEQRDFAKLAVLWTSGIFIDWNLFYPDLKPHGTISNGIHDRPCHIKLPSYPFARESYWYTEETGIRTVESVANRSTYYLQKQWKSYPIHANKPLYRSADTSRIAILTTEETRELAVLLSREFSQSHILSIQEIKTHLQLPREERRAFDGCVDLVGCGKERVESLDGVKWLQQWIKQGLKEASGPMKLTLLGVTRGLESYQNSSINLSGASRVGLYRMLQSEYSHLQSRHMDADPGKTGKALAKQIALEFQVNDEVPEICYRNEKRYCAHLVARQTEKMPGKDPVFPEENVLWITGGTRGLGYLCAQHFVAHYGVKRLVLTGREELPPRNQWSSYSGENESITKKIHAIQHLEDQGVMVRTLSISLTDQSALEESLQEITGSMGPIGGVIHCAGIEDTNDPAFIRKTMEGVQQVLDPKIAGLDNLLTQSQQEPLQFFLLFSSVSAIIPGLASGLSDYAMANAYMDYVAEARVYGCPLISIQWPSWKETGMGEVKNSAYEQTGLLSHTNQEGLLILDQILSHEIGPVVLPAVVNEELWNPQELLKHKIHKSLSSRSFQKKTDSLETSDSLLTSVQTWLIELFSHELAIDPEEFDLDTPFQDYGSDSILLSQILRKVELKLGASLDPSILLEYSTLGSLASHLVATQTPSLSKELVTQTALTLSSAKYREKSRSASSDIAVVGMSCRFPGAGNLEEYWQLLSEGRSAISLVPGERWETSDHFYAGLLDEITHFDPSFFLIPEEDARAMDPQALLVLEESLNLFSHAGYSLQEIKGSSTGVYLGARSQHQSEERVLHQARNPIVAVGQNYLASNVSQFFDLKGPGMVVDTACSSALTSMNLAINALVSGEIDSALVGGVCLLPDDSTHRLFQQRNLLSKESSFHIFDQRASGVIPGEGVGLILLKTSEQARKDGDTIYAIIKSVAVNNDGRTAGPATPNIQAQKEVMQTALEKTEIKPVEISYIEVNGSGSEVTDLLELKALEAVYGPFHKTPCSLGSAKPNIGHPLCAEGMAGFIKLVLMLERRQQVPFLSGESPMSHYKIESSPFSFCRELTEWAGTTRVAALNCFADGGTNAHVILESLPEDQPGNSELTLVHRKPISPPELQRVRIREGSGTFPQRERDPIKITNPWTETLDSNHPVFKSHTAFGQELLPGLAYIDLLYQYFREKGYAYDELELRNLSIFHPLIVRQGDNIRLDIQCSKVKPDVWKIQVKGQEKLYINAEMHRQEPTVFEERLDFNSIRNSAQKTVPLSDIYDQCRNLELVHTGFLKARGTIYSLDDANFIQISLPPEATPGAYDFMFHPTLLDSSAVGSGGLFSSQAKQELFLPLFYKSFRASSLLQSQCITRIRTSSREEKKELISLDMEFFHVSGEKIGELKNFTNKRVPETGFVNPSQRKATPQKTNGRPSLQQNRRTADSSERFLKEVIASQLKISTEEIDSDCGYYEMGLSSSMLLLVVKEIEKKLSTTLSPILLFEYTNIRELANHLKELAGSSPEETHQEVQSVAFDEREGSFKPLSATVSTEEVGAEDTDDIAIIGLAGRYPGAENIEEFWINLKAGKDCITTIPSERWDEKIWENLKSPTGKKLSKWGGFIQNHDCFDPQFFRISPREAETMDPQERLFLQACSEVMEDAGYTASNLVVPHGRHQRRKVGVFVGVMHNDYTIIGAESITTGERFPLSINYAPIANRVSYYYNFHGPSLAIDTVCSSSLTAVHLAIGSILRGESQVAIAGGVNLSLHPNKYLTYGLMDMHASDGRCHTFGDGGDGYVSGEGIGAVLLKPLKRAVQDQDHIYAVIKGSAINHGGKVSGFTVPSPVAHSHVIEECLERAGIGARTISCVEAHGTGTSLGDPIEIQGLAKAYAQNTSDLQFCSIGSVKSNIGHAESAAGISGLSKVVLQLHHKTLVPSLHAETENPHINFKASPFFVQHKTETWQQPVITSNGKSHSCPRRAGLSSFGAYGSNAHLILEEYIPQTVGSMAAGDTKNSPVLIPLSAKNEERLRVYANKLHTFLEEADQSIDLRQIAYTLQFGREAMEARVVFLVKKNEELHEKLKAFAGGESITNHCWQGGLKQEKKTISLFSPEDIQQMVNKWIAEGKLEKLAELWAQGFTLNWQSLYEEGDSQHVGCADGRPLRVSLPTYPFAKQRYWVPTDRQADTIQRQTTVSDSVITPLSPHVLPQDGLVSVESPVHSLLLAPVWNSLTFPESNIPVPAKTEQVVIVGGTQDQKSKIKQLYPLADLLQMDNPQTIDELVNKITTLGSIEHFVWIVPSIPLISMAEESIIQDQDQGIFPVFRVIKALLSLGYGDQVLSWTFITTQTLAVGRQEEVNPTHASLHGLIGSVAKEYPRWKIRYLDMETEGDWPIREIFLLPFDVQGEALVYRRKEWFKATLVSYRSSFSDHPLYRPEGVYVVIGGSGGLGEVWSKYMIEHYQARIIWIGRRKMNEEIQHKLDVLAKLGPAPQYISADATNPQSLQKAYEEIKQNHTRIHGVIHSAVGIFDQSLAKMEEKQFRDILSVKIDVSVRMAQVFQSEPLDFVLFFSSIAAWEKAGGMSGYSAGSTFKDAFALQLSRDWNCKVKVMNWGNWSIGTGDTISKASKIRLQQAGIRTIDVKEGLEALEVLLTGSRDQLVFMKTQNPQGLEIMDSNEWMTGYPETIPSCVNNIQKIAKPEVQQQNLQSASIFQNEAIEEPLLKLYGGILQSLRLIGTDKTATDPIAFYHRWLAESRKILTKRNALPNNPSLALEAIWKEWEQTTSHWKQDPDKKAAVILVEACLRALPDILTGKQRATDVIFPQASMELVEGLFRGNLVADYFNEFLGNALVAIIQQRSVLEQSKHSDPTAIRILEIGAGTGGTTANILPKLKPFRQQIEEYCYTDISKAFLFHAEEHFASQYPYIRTQLFDVEKPLAQQNIQAGQYDLVIATNVLHATKNIRQTLRNAKALLRKRGIILLNEISDKSLYAHLTFGLLEGWWLNEDDALRIPGSPALYPEVWQRVLQEEGFYSVLFPAQSEHRLGQQIVIAESDGIIRQKQEHTVKTGELPEQPLRRVPVKSPQKEITQDLIKEKTTEYFKTLVGKTLKIEASQIDSSEPLESYGIDSILIGQITSVLREEFDEVKGTLFFEVQTIDALVEYFINNHKERLSEIFGPNHPGAEEEIVDEETSQPTELGLEMPEHLQTSAGTEQPVKIHQGKGDQEKIQSASDAIAVIGMSGRYPKAETLENYWENLQTGRSCITEVPMDRWSLTGFFEPDPDKAVAEGKSYNKWGGFLDGFADFDPLFFNISAQDANDMDPQGRLLLQECWRAFEEAGYVPSQLDLELRDHIGVYCAMTKVGYNTSFAAMVNRVSYAMDLQGPSIPVDAMCASGLVALHQACESLRRRDIHMALVGAVNLYVEPNAYIKLCRLQMLADSAVPKVFGEGGKGFVPSEGVGAVVLKRLADAERDNDTVLAVIRGSAVNHNGKVNGYGVPNPLKQEAVIRHALENARVSPESIAYVESAANGSEMGDAIEMEALTRIFQHNRNGNPSAYRIGSLKSTLGHGESVSAMAQFMKVVLQLNHKKLCPTRVSEQRNPEIHFDTLPFTIQSELEDWPQLSLKGKKIPRRAGINSMGAGGVNAHMIVEEYLPPIVKEPNLAPASAPVVFVLSAKTEQVFTHYLTLWKDYLGKHPGSDLTRLAFSLQMGREMMKYRFACVVTSSKELILCLESAAKKESQPHCYKGVIDHTENIGALIEDHQIESLLVKKDLNKLARLWVNGATISWEKLYLEEMPKHLPLLPTYPFVRKTYWHGAMPTPELPEKIAQCTADNNGANFPVEKLLPSVGGDNDPCSVDLKPTRKIIRAVINNMLNFDTEDEIDQGMSFSEMGFSSITIVLFIEKLNQEFDLTLRETTAFDYPNIQELTLYISTQLLEREEKQVSIETEIKKSDGEEGPINKNEYESILLDFVQNKINEQDALDQIGL